MLRGRNPYVDDEAEDKDNAQGNDEEEQGPDEYEKDGFVVSDDDVDTGKGSQSQSPPHQRELDQQLARNPNTNHPSDIVPNRLKRLAHVADKYEAVARAKKKHKTSKEPSRRNEHPPSPPPPSSPPPSSSAVIGLGENKIQSVYQSSGHEWKSESNNSNPEHPPSLLGQWEEILSNTVASLLDRKDDDADSLVEHIEKVLDLILRLLGCRNFSAQLAEIESTAAERKLPWPSNRDIDNKFQGLDTVFRLFPMSETTSIDLIDSMKAKYDNMVYAIAATFLRIPATPQYREAYNRIERKFTQSLEIIQRAWHVRCTLLEVHGALNPQYRPFGNAAYTLQLRIVSLTGSDLSKAMALMFDYCSARGYCRDGTNVLAPVLVAGKRINAYKRVGTIAEMLNIAMTHSVAINEALSANNGIMENVAKRLESTASTAFPPVQRNSRYIAYKNCFYDAYRDEVYSHEDATARSLHAGRYFDVDLDPEIVDAFGGDFETGNWMDFPHTAHFDSISHTQWRDPNLDAKVAIERYGYDVKAIPPECVVENAELMIRWHYAFLGRALFPNCSRDKWQMAYLLTGAAGTGKGRVLDLFDRYFSGVEKCAITGNPDGDRFALTDLSADTLILIINEMRKDFHVKFPMADWLAIVAGESVQQKSKGVNAKQVPKTQAQTVMFGNEFGFPADGQGELRRRLMWFKYPYTLRDDEKNSELIEDVRKNIPYVAIKVIKAYNALLQFVEAKGAKDIHPLIPPFFRKNIDDWISHADPLTSFLKKSGSVEFGPHLRCPNRSFRDAFFAYLQDNHIQKKPWNLTDDKVKTTLANCGVSITKDSETHEWPRPENVNGQGPSRSRKDIWLIGCDLTTQMEVVDVA
jgi:hypothetical protein